LFLTILFFKDFIHLIERETARKGTQGEEGEAGFLLSGEPHAGLDPRTLGP